MTNLRYRFTFGKGHELRFTGHLNLHRAWERTLRRAGVSLAYSEGFNPRPKINLGAALPLGCTSEADLIDIETTGGYQPNVLLQQVIEAAPPGLAVHVSETVPPGSPKLQKLIVSAVYIVPIPGNGQNDLGDRIQEILDAEQLERVRRDKKYDLRPLIEDLRLDDTGAIHFQVAARSNATGRPDEVLRALGLDPEPLVPHRIRLILREEPAS